MKLPDRGNPKPGFAYDFLHNTKIMTHERVGASLEPQQMKPQL